MSWQVAIMFAVAGLLALGGLGLLAALARPSGPAKVYVFRMAGIMALAAGVVLAFFRQFDVELERAAMSCNPINPIDPIST